MKIYTRGGDAGETVLIGGLRVQKDDPRVGAYGSVDELGAALGLARALDDGVLDGERIRAVQDDLFAVGARLAAIDPDRARDKGTIPAFDPERVTALERWIDTLDAELRPLDSFILSGGSLVAAQLHVARTVCRRAERVTTALLPDQPDLADFVLPYLNRLSDLLFTLARAANARAGVEDVPWIPQRRRGLDSNG